MRVHPKLLKLSRNDVGVHKDVFGAIISKNLSAMWYHLHVLHLLIVLLSVYQIVL